MGTTKAKALFLDRDGIVNVDHGYVGHYKDFEYVDGIFPLMRRFEQAGYKLVIVTNQSGIGRGLYSEKQFNTLMERVQQDFTHAHIGSVAVYYCPHHAEKGIGEYKISCECRKPAPGMLNQAAKDLSISLHDSIMVGDSWRDIQAAQAVNVAHCYYMSAKKPPVNAQLCKVTQVATLNDIAPI